jgi:transcription antitermination factor NusG
MSKENLVPSVYTWEFGVTQVSMDPTMLLQFANMLESSFKIGDRVRYNSDVFKDSWGEVAEVQLENGYPFYFVKFDDPDSSLNQCRFMLEQLIREEPLVALARC